MHKSLYHALFESHLSCYGIAVWEKVSNVKIHQVFVAQKYCLRIMFGEKEAYLRKNETAARVRPIDLQNLGSDFYMLEHTKSLFINYNELLTVHNLYNYHSILSKCKNLKLHTPIALYPNKLPQTNLN